MPAPDRRSLGGRVASALDDIDFCGVAIVDGPDGALVEVARGAADRSAGRPHTASGRFGLASASKMFTAVAVLRLVERGAATLDTPVTDLLPAADRPTRLDAAVTLRHLLTHTSGMTDYFAEDGDEPYEATWSSVPSYRMRTPRDMLELFRDLPQRAAPGTEVRYCNAAFVLLALVVEALSQRSFPEAVDFDVFRPAAMTSSGYPGLDDVAPGLAVGYLPPDAADRRWRSNIFSIPVVGGGDGGAVSTAADVVGFLRALRDGVFGSGPLFQAAFAPATRDPGGRWSYGLGLQVGDEGRRRWIGHPGEDPGYSARAVWYPADDLRLVLLSNVTDGAGGARRAVETVLFD